MRRRRRLDYQGHDGGAAVPAAGSGEGANGMVVGVYGVQPEEAVDCRRETAR